MTPFVMVSTTTDSAEKAREIGLHLVENTLAACVQIVGPIESIYRWQGGVEKAREWLCLAKTRADLFTRIEKAIVERHAYETPEIVAWPLEEGSRDYFSWLESSLSPVE